jgi:hypothetical protein
MTKYVGEWRESPSSMWKPVVRSCDSMTEATLLMFEYEYDGIIPHGAETRIVPVDEKTGLLL